MHAKDWKALHKKKIIFKLPGLTLPKVLKLRLCFLFWSACRLLQKQVQTFHTRIPFIYNFWLRLSKKMKLWIFKHYDKTKIKFKIMVLTLKDGLRLFELRQLELSGFKTLGKDRFEKLFKKIKFFYYFFKFKTGKIHKKKIGKLHLY